MCTHLPESHHFCDDFLSHINYFIFYHDYTVPFTYNTCAYYTSLEPTSSLPRTGIYQSSILPQGVVSKLPMSRMLCRGCRLSLSLSLCGGLGIVLEGQNCLELHLYEFPPSFFPALLVIINFVTSVNRKQSRKKEVDKVWYGKLSAMSPAGCRRENSCLSLLSKTTNS